MSQPNIAAVVTAFADQAQAIEDALYGLILGRGLPWALGTTLDLIGSMVGISRPIGMLDDGYRAIIYGRIIVNTSPGTTETVYSLLRILGSTAAIIREPGGYSMLIDYSGDLLLSDAAFLAVLVQATPPVEIDVTQYAVGYFGFDDDPDALGFDDGELSRSVT